MVEKIGLRHKIAGEFISGLSTVDELNSPSAEVNVGQQDMHISPELAADFEHGLESVIGDSCGCGHACSGDHPKNAVGSCPGCHHHG